MTQPKAGSTVIGFMLGIVTATVLAATGTLMFRLAGGRFVRVDASRPAVVSQIQRLQRLETVVFGIDRIVIGEREVRYMPRVLAGERLLLIVFGEVVAGVDLGRVRADDVEVSGRAVRLRLPEPEIFTTRLDNARTRVYSRETGLFSPVDPNLESAARRDAEQQIRQAAIDAKILDVAKANAAATLTSFLRGLEFDSAEVEWHRGRID
jgi:hypothetical protein